MQTIVARCLALSTFLAISAASALETAIVERGPHHRRWQTAELVPASDGQSLSVAHEYVELRTGLHYRSGNQWLESAARIEPAPQGARAPRGHQKIEFEHALNHPRGAVSLATDEGIRWRSRLLGLAYYDAASGRDAILATVQHSAGEILPPNQIVYRHAFDRLDADVLYTYDIAGLEQDVILREPPPPPESFGLVSAATRLEVITEFIGAPEPVKRVRPLRTLDDPNLRAAMADPDWLDEDLDFGTVSLAPGRAFAIADRPPVPDPPSIMVSRKWDKIDNRSILFESVDYEDVRSDLDRLDATKAGRRSPGRQASADSPARRQWLARALESSPSSFARRPDRLETALAPRALPQPSAATEVASAIQIARADSRSVAAPGFVLDYVTLSTATNFTFHGDTTYYVSGLVALSGCTVFEGGSVIKFAPVTSLPRILVRGPLLCQTAPYRPLVMTARDDNSIGDVIAGSTGLPQGEYAYQALGFMDPISPCYLEHFSVAHAAYGVLTTSTQNTTIRHSQLLQCRYPVFAARSGPVRLQNVLIQSVRTNGIALISAGAHSFTGEHVTVNRAPALHNGAPVALTNSLIVGVPSIASFAADHSAIYPSAEGVFVSGAGGHAYLAPASPARDCGTPSIDPALRSELARRTTDPPLALSGEIRSNTRLQPAAQRDSDDLDLGYHYPALDYYTAGLRLAAATLEIAPGVALGCPTTASVRLESGSRVICRGSPLARNHIVSMALFEEFLHPISPPPSSSQIFTADGNLSTAPELEIAWTDIDFPADPISRRRLIPPGDCFLGRLAARHCAFHNLYFYQRASVPGRMIEWNNNLFDRCLIYWHQPPGSSPFGGLFAHNYVRAGTLAMVNYLPDAGWEVRDNLLDAAAIIRGTAPINASHNAFRNTVSLGGSQNIALSICDFQPGPEGPFCYPAAGSQLARLRDAGSRPAPAAGLSHHTTAADGRPEESSQVDIGFHYPARTPDGAWPDADGDHIPDCLEDFNGNLLFEPNQGETDWQTSQHALASSSSLEVFNRLEHLENP